MTDWYAASLHEIKALIDRFENEESITIHREDDEVAALLAMLGAGVVVAQAAGALAHSVDTLGRLRDEP